MKIGGMGDEVVGIPIAEIRRVAVSPPKRNGYASDWIPYPKLEDPVIYLHIRHRYCPRVYLNGTLSFSYLDDFLIRFRGIQENERSKKGQPVPEYLKGQAWVEDDFNG